MRVLVILAAHVMLLDYCDNIRILHDYVVGQPNTYVEYCGISNKDDFSNYESILSFRYKVLKDSIKP